jgi:hypothetical protein
MNDCRASPPWFHCFWSFITIHPRLGSIWLPSLPETVGTYERTSPYVRRWSDDSGEDVVLLTRLNSSTRWFCQPRRTVLPCGSVDKTNSSTMWFRQQDLQFHHDWPLELPERWRVLTAEVIMLINCIRVQYKLLEKYLFLCHWNIHSR